MPDQSLLVKVPARCLLFILLFIISACKVTPVFLRDNQQANLGKADDIVRIYLDKFGAFYPAATVDINRQDFARAPFLESPLKNTASFNLAAYFTAEAQRMEPLRAAYGIAAGADPACDFRAVQAAIIGGYVNDIRNLAARHGAGMVIFLVHGFNEPRPELPDKYPLIRQAIAQDAGAVLLKPVIVEVYWDGLDALGYQTLREARIWPYAQYNSRWEALSLRNFIGQMEAKVQLPVALVTHSLGASVATGALFNTTSKWNDTRIDPASAQKLADLGKIPTPVVEARLGMLAPAIPGTATFADFDKRSPADIRPGQNNIKKVVIAYDPFDFATSKDLLKLVSLAPVDGATTLGCNYYSPKTRYTEIESVFNIMASMGYTSSELQTLMHPIRFNTGVRPGSGGNDEHFMEYYIRDTAYSKLFFEELFK